MSAKLTKKGKETFESIKKIDEEGKEYWTARDLCQVLGYSEYRFFLPAARKAWTACKESGQNPENHFVVMHDMIIVGKGAQRQVDNIKMSRYATTLSIPSTSVAKNSRTGTLSLLICPVFCNKYRYFNVF